MRLDRRLHLPLTSIPPFPPSLPDQRLLMFRPQRSVLVREIMRSRRDFLIPIPLFWALLQRFVELGRRGVLLSEGGSRLG